MIGEELKLEVAIEFDVLQQVVDELEALRQDVAGREPTVREKTAAAAFLAQFYSGIENILKRLSRFHGVELPVGENWHLLAWWEPALRNSPRRADWKVRPPFAPSSSFRWGSPSI